MLLDYGSSWLMGNRGEAAISFQAPVVLQHCRSFFILLC